MRLLLKILGGFLALVIVVFAGQMISSETGEVVVLHSTNPAGEVETTRLWVVDFEGAQYLRETGGTSGWYTRLTANPAIRVERGGELADYTAVPQPEHSARINELMLDKYGFRDRYVGLLIGSREGAIPVMLEPESS